MYQSSRHQEYLKEFSSVAIDALWPILHLSQRELMQALAKKNAQSDWEKSLTKSIGGFDNEDLKDNFFASELGIKQWLDIKEEKTSFSEDVRDAFLDKLQLEAIILGLSNVRDGVHDYIMIPFNSLGNGNTHITLYSIEELIEYLYGCGISSIADKLQKNLSEFTHQKILERKAPPLSPEKKHFKKFLTLANESIVKPLLKTRQEEFEAEHTAEAIDIVLSIEKDMVSKNIQNLKDILHEIPEDKRDEHEPIITAQIRKYEQMYKFSIEKRSDEAYSVMHALDILKNISSIFELVAKRGHQFSFMGEVYKNEHDIFELCQTLLAKYEKSHRTPRVYLEGLFKLKQMLPISVKSKQEHTI